MIRAWWADEPKVELKLEGIAEFQRPDPERPGKTLTVRVDRSRLLELRDTKDLAELAAKAREITEIKRND